MSLEAAPYGPSWHNSVNKYTFDAIIAREIGTLALWITHGTMQLLHPGALITQKRVGQHGHLFDMLKVQTLERPDLPLHERKVIVPLAKFVRRIAFDELIQVVHVSLDPKKPGPMSVVGPRPQMEEELEHMFKVMHGAGQEQQFYDYRRAYDAMRPGIVGPDSLIGEFYEPGTLGYYEARCRTTIDYYEQGSEQCDMHILSVMMAIGAVQANSILPELLPQT